MTCDRCGAVEAPIDEVRLEVSVDGGPNAVLFTCPRCGTAGRQVAEERATRLLATAGVVLVTPALASHDADVLPGHEPAPAGDPGAHG